MIDLEGEILSWDRRCRGYQVWESQVELEPPFVRLLEQARNAPESAVIDDGKKGSIFTFWKREPEPPPAPNARPEPTPSAFHSAPTVELQLILPEAFVVKPGFVTDFFSALHNLSHPVAFEVIGHGEEIVSQLCVARRDQAAVISLLNAYFPELKTREHASYLSDAWDATGAYVSAVDFGLSEWSCRMLKAGPGLESDPLIAVVGAMEQLEEQELGLLQVLFTPTVAPWGSDLYDLAEANPELSGHRAFIRAKFSQSLHAAVVRVASCARDSERCLDLMRQIGNTVIAATRSDWNQLIPLSKEGYPAELHEHDILARETHRSGMLLTPSELVTLVHPPSASVRSRRLKRQSEKTKAAPVNARNRSFVLGTNEHDGETTTVGLSIEQRLRHTYVVGASGTGKSTLLLSMIAQDMETGRGVAVLDPHGDLIEDVLARVPDDRISDVVLVDPSDEEYPVGFNILSAHSEIERMLLSSDLVASFKRLSTSWGDVMTTIMGNAVLAFLEHPEGGTLLDLRRFLLDASFRKRIVADVRDPEIVYFWESEFPLLRGTPQAPLLTRLDTFLRPKLIRYMVAQKNDRLDMRAIMDSGKILLAKLSQGTIGEENSYLLGSLIVAKINQAAMSRQQQERSSRSPFFVYIDEFHNFITPSIGAILSGARKYSLGLTLSHQTLRQVTSRSDAVAGEILGNAYTRVVFRVGEQDARSLADGFSFFEGRDLLNLGVGDAIARVEQSAFDFNLKTQQLTAVSADKAKARREKALTASRAAYAAPSSTVEDILRTARGPSEPSSPRQDKTPRGKRSSRDTQTDDSVDKASPPSQPSVPPSSPGRGSAQHKYLQSLIRRLAEDREFDVSLEETVLEGHGHIDVALVGNGLRVAIEISVTTNVEHEVGNLTKCLASGFDYAVLVSSDARTLDLARAEMAGADARRVRFLSPGQVASFLDEAAQLPEERRTRPSVNRAPRDDSTPVDGLLTTERAAAYLGVAVQTLAKMRVSGESPPFHKIGRRVVYNRADLDEWIKERKRRSTSDR